MEGKPISATGTGAGGEALPDVWADVVGQPAAVAALEAAARSPVHAYLLTGPAGSGKRAAARGFAALVLSAGTTGTDAARHRVLALAETHPDLRVVDPEGSSVRTDEAAALLAAAARSPVEGTRKVVLGSGFGAVQPQAVGMLLKGLEEPSRSTVFVLTADEVGPELATVASRCVVVELGAVAPAAVGARLRAEGVAPDRADAVAALAGGDLTRARLLAADERFALRHEAYRAAPGRLDGTGATASELAAELAGLADDASAALAERQAREAAELDERIARYGARGSGRARLEERHKREQRRARTGELRFALATMAGCYRQAVLDGGPAGPFVDAAARIEATAVAFERNPAEALALTALLATLPPLS